MDTEVTEFKIMEVLQRALDGDELSVSDGELLLQVKGKDLQDLVQTADEERRRSVGDTVTFVRNRNINFTNICSGSCSFCAFKRSQGDPDAYVLSLKQIATKVREALGLGATEVCVQGGLHPDFALKNYIEILRTIKEISPEIHVHGFSPAELDHIALQENLSISEVIKTLQDSGLNSVPGTAAEVLDERVRSIVCPNKITSSRWIEVVKTCHSLGLHTTASMLYGTVETPRELAEHIALLRDIQRSTRGFTEFVLLGFMPYHTPLWRDDGLPSPSISDSLRVHAVSRLMLAGYIDNVQVSWVKLGPSTAQLMLNAGANDLGGTLMEESITRAAGGCLQSMRVEQLEQLILEIGRIPRQRSTTYELI